MKTNKSPQPGGPLIISVADKHESEQVDALLRAKHPKEVPDRVGQELRLIIKGVRPVNDFKIATNGSSWSVIIGPGWKIAYTGGRIPACVKMSPEAETPISSALLLC